MNRRQWITAGAASTLGASVALRASHAANVTLAAAAARNGRTFGSAVRIDQLRQEPDLRETVLQQCQLLVPEIEMNWNQLEPAYGQFTFYKMDALAAFAISNAKELRGHTLLWHLGTPDWVGAMLAEKRDWNLIARYFGSVIPRYGDAIHQWEVVNESIAPGSRMDGLRPNVFLQAFGPDYIRRALQQARTFAPNAQLLITEYGLEYDLQDERYRRYLLLKLLESLKYADAPLDGLGLQAHLDLRKGTIAPKAIAAFLQEVSHLGLEIFVTELDVKEAEYTSSPQRRDMLVGDEVRRYLDVVLPFASVKGVSTWGLSDRHSWLQVTPDDYARFPGAWPKGGGPGLNRGLPFDSSMRPTPMFYALRNALATIRPRSR